MKKLMLGLLFISGVLLTTQSNARVVNILDFKISNPTAMACQWENPMGYSTEWACQSSCHFDCGIIYGSAYTGSHGCVQTEHTSECVCLTCY